MSLIQTVALVLTISAITAATAAPASRDAASTAAAAEAKRPAPVSEKAFAQKATSNGLAEIKMGELAQEKSDNEVVRRFAIKVANDYENVYQKLRTATKEMGITTKNKTSTEQNQQYDAMAQLSGSKFDEAYIKAKVKDYGETVQLFRLEARKGDASELQLFAAYIVPKLEQHLAAAQDIHEALKTADSRQSRPLKGAI